MAQAFRDQLRDAASSRWSFVRLWHGTLLDWARTVFTAHATLPCANEGLKAIFFAHYEASSFSHPQVTLEDLLLGALRADRAFASRILESSGGTDIRAELNQSAATNLRHKAVFGIALSESCKRALKLADEEAHRARALRATPRHLIARNSPRRAEPRGASVARARSRLASRSLQLLANQKSRCRPNWIARGLLDCPVMTPKFCGLWRLTDGSLNST